jgi:hypothetical protein
MSNTSRSFMMLDGWRDVMIRTVTIFLVAFVALNLKEYLLDAPDVPACTIDAAVVAAGAFLLYATLFVTSGSPEKPEKRAVSVGH